jgi:ribosomal protein L40E
VTRQERLKAAAQARALKSTCRKCLKPGLVREVTTNGADGKLSQTVVCRFCGARPKAGKQ